MKKLLSLFLLALFVFPIGASAQGMPAAHGTDGRTFGGLVSSKAQTDPSDLVAHVSSRGNGGSKGMPAAHETDGRTFGGLVSSKAQTDPGFLSSHVGRR